VRIGIGLPNQVRGAEPAIIPSWAAAAERAGFVTLATVGRIAYPGVMDTVALAAAAASTDSAELLAAVALGPVWPPVLLAKEAAGIDAVSGGRLTLGLGVGLRRDDFVVGGLGMAARGRRLDEDLDVYRRVWQGEPVGGGPSPAVTPGAREIPLMFGGGVAAAYQRVARRGTGYIGPSVPAAMVAPLFEGTRAAWDEAGRAGSPRLVAIAYFALGDQEQGLGNVWDYYSISGSEVASLITGAVAAGPDGVRETVKAFGDIGATDIILNPAVGDQDEIARLADIVL
jgi:alkanesulfonate monooxygenase SsuD/methylene tetrahydromethanopterin reductase-like flavin-dependent oxidoreductase (luciferase family)